MKEVWKNLYEFEELYQVSNLGNIRAKSKIDASGHLRGLKLLKPFLCKSGRNRCDWRVNLYKDGKRFTGVSLSRLMAKTFIEECREKYFRVSIKDASLEQPCALDNLEIKISETQK